MCLVLTDRSVGVLTLVVNFMLVDVGVFATLLFLITIGFGFAFAVLQPQLASENRFGFVLGAHPFWLAWWGLFGEFDLDTIYEQAGEQQPTAILAPVFLWVYEFFSVVLLMNLLVALMSDTYARVTAEGELRWKYARAQLIREYLTQSPLPAPFNILYYAFYSMPRAAYRAHRRYMYGEEAVAHTGFSFVPTQKILASLRRAELDAVRNFLQAQQDADRKEATSMAEATQNQLGALIQTNTLRFEAINQRIDQVLRRISEVQMHGQKMDDGALGTEQLDDLSWSTPLDGQWYAPPAFTKSDVGSTVSFAPSTWEVQRLLRLSEGDGVRASAGQPALATATIASKDGRREERVLAWRGEWSGSADGHSGFAKIDLGNVPASSVSAFRIEHVSQDAVMEEVVLTPVMQSSDRSQEKQSKDPQSLSGIRLVPLTQASERSQPKDLQSMAAIRLENPERFPNTARIRQLPTISSVSGANIGTGPMAA